MDKEARELNELVARKLGWTIDKTSDFLPWYGPPNSRPESAMIREIPDYVGDIKAAWDIVEKYPITITHEKIVLSDRESFWRWRATIQIGPNHLEDSFISEIADTAPLAICRTFLNLS